MSRQRPERRVCRLRRSTGRAFGASVRRLSARDAEVFAAGEATYVRGLDAKSPPRRASGRDGEYDDVPDGEPTALMPAAAASKWYEKKPPAVTRGARDLFEGFDDDPMDTRTLEEAVHAPLLARRASGRELDAEHL